METVLWFLLRIDGHKIEWISVFILITWKIKWLMGSLERCSLLCQVSAASRLLFSPLPFRGPFFAICHFFASHHVMHWALIYAGAWIRYDLFLIQISGSWNRVIFTQNNGVGNLSLQIQSRFETPGSNKGNMCQALGSWSTRCKGKYHYTKLFVKSHTNVKFNKGHWLTWAPPLGMCCPSKCTAPQEPRTTSTSNQPPLYPCMPTLPTVRRRFSPEVLEGSICALFNDQNCIPLHLRITLPQRH